MPRLCSPTKIRISSAETGLVFVSVTVRDRLGKVCNQVRGTLVVDGSSHLTRRKTPPDGKAK